MEFRILGPLEVVGERGPIAVGGAKQQALLALLLLNANEVVSIDRLIDELWEGEPPGTARKAVQVHVSNLRKALGDGRIETQAPGYRLRVEAGELDLDRFEELRARGDAASLREALALWRGAPLANFAYQAFAQTEIARLDELRLGTLERRIEADLEAGNHQDLVPELDRLIAAEPLRERLRAQLMLVLYRSGRQADALEAYQAARRALLGELGIEPGRALQELQAALLRQDPELDMRAAGPVIEPRPPAALRATGVLVGREPELAEGLRALDETLAGRGRLLLISGEPGIGKSRLAEELTDRAAARNAEVLVGRCWEAGGAPPYWPWAQALRDYARRADPRALRQQLGAGSADVASVVPEIRHVLPDVPEPAAPDDEGARFRLFASVASFLENASRAQPLVVCLDDLHAADTPSLLLLQFLASELERMRMLVVGAYRDVDPTVSEELAATLGAISRRESTRRIVLKGLSREEVRRFVELNGGAHAPDSLSATLSEDTEGNPLFVGEMLRLLAAEGRLEEPGARVAVPETVREVIGRRLHHLSNECRRVLTLASVMGREFGLVALERTADYPGIDRLLEVLDEAIGARVVAEVPGTLGRLRFAHALIRDTLYAELPATRRVRLHKRVVDVLDDLYRADLEPHLAELAHHAVAAVPAVDASAAADYARRAGDRAAALLAYEEAARMYELALLALDLDEAVADDVRCDLLLALGEARTRAGEMDAAKKTFLAVADLARRRQLRTRLARAALGYGGRIVWVRAGQDRRLVPLLEEALEALGEDDIELRARLLSRLAGALRDEPSRSRRDALTAEAVRLARSDGNDATLAYALDGRSAAIIAPDTVSEVLALATEQREVARRGENTELVVAAHSWRFMCSLLLGDRETADAEAAAAQRLVRELRQPVHEWRVRAEAILLDLVDGRFDDVETAAREALDIGEPVMGVVALAHYHLERYTATEFQGGTEQLEGDLRALAAGQPARPVFRCALAHAHAQLGRTEEAALALRELTAAGVAAVPFDQEWLLALSYLAETAVALEERDAAATLYHALLPYAGLNAVDVAEAFRGSVSHYLAVLGRLLDRPDADRHFQDALEMNERMRATPWVTRTQQQYANPSGPAVAERSG